jgi:hypothetical protein
MKFTIEDHIIIWGWIIPSLIISFTFAPLLPIVFLWQLCAIIIHVQKNKKYKRKW